MYSGSVFGMYDEMVSIVCLIIAALVFLLFGPYKDNFWLNVWDSTSFSLIAFALFCNMYAQYISPVPTALVAVLATIPLMYFIVYVTYKLLTWTKAVRLCKKGTEHPTIESQEPDRLLHPEEYGSEEHKCNGFMCVDCLPFTNNVLDNGLCFYCSLIIYIQLH